MGKRVGQKLGQSRLQYFVGKMLTNCLRQKRLGNLGRV